MIISPKLRKPASLRPRAASPKKQREEFIYATGKSSLGLVLTAFSEFGLTAVMIGKTQAQLVGRLQERFPKIDLREDNKTTAKALARIIAFIDKPAGSPPDMSLDIRGTSFQRRVWQEATRIRLGQTATYSDIAAAIGSPHAMRAVGSACTNNLFAIIIPCHRVVHKGEGANARPHEFLKREKSVP